jgi:alpha-amylase/alpha-mannosidase (GH57 family)
MKKFVCIHGHFYQPPRENPWLEEVEVQDSAAPYHDWNERITAECYEPNTASRIVNAKGHIIDIINNFAKISFNIGPTLHAWLARHRPEVSDAIVAADKLSREKFAGHGGAIAQVYNHMIMPLATRRDKFTQAYWGIVDFEKRFGRYPEGMWLPETAVDIETLEVLAELRIQFAILAPHQAHRVRAMREDAPWEDASQGVDTTMPYRCDLPSGKSLALFFYDGAISHDLAFNHLLNSGEEFAGRLKGAFRNDDVPQLVHVATDGETYGHHHRYGDMALSYCLNAIELSPDVALTNYGEFLSRFPPTHTVEVLENSSWSCVHGIERWRANCGCNSGRQGWTQAWRKPLREGLDRLRDTLAPRYEEAMTPFVADPWRARNDYIEVISNRSRESVKRFLSRHLVRDLSHDETVKVLKLLEMQRDCMLMFTSCAWFFDEISGIETTQVLRYAAEASQFAEELFGVNAEQELIDTLAQAPSNTVENGAQAYEKYVRVTRLDLLRVGAHYAIASLFTDHTPRSGLFCYTIEAEAYQAREAGKAKITVGRVRVSSDLTLENSVISFAALHLGDQNVNGGVRPFMGEDAFAQMQADIMQEFDKGHMTAVLQMMVKHFGTNNYSVWHLFRDEQRRVLHKILQTPMQNISRSLRQVYEENSGLMSLLQAMHHPIPEQFLSAATHVVNENLERLFEDKTVDVNVLESLVQQITKWSLQIHREALRYKISGWVNARVEDIGNQPLDTQAIQTIRRMIETVEALHLELDLWKAQNAYFTMGVRVRPEQDQRAASGDQNAQTWLEAYARLGTVLKVAVE